MSRPEDTVITFEDEPAEAIEWPRDRFPLIAWWETQDATERTLWRGLAGVSAGLAAIYWPLALIVPGAVLTGLALFTVAVVMMRSR